MNDPKPPKCSSCGTHANVHAASRPGMIPGAALSYVWLCGDCELLMENEDAQLDHAAALQAQGADASGDAVLSEPRYIVRELYGQTIGAHSPSWQFLVLDSDDCYRVMLERHSGREVNNNHLRRCVYEYAAVLNNPRVCACGCGEELTFGFPVRKRGGNERIYVDKIHCDRACEDRRRERRRAAYTSKRERE